MRYAVANILDHLPKELQELPDVELVRPEAVRKIYNIVELIYRTQSYEGDSKDYEFSRRSMELHWESGYADTITSLKDKRIFKRSDTEIVQTFDAALETENELKQREAV
jgi:NTE family protein